MTTESRDDAPLLGALLRMPIDAVRHRMLEDLHAAGHTELVAAHSAVFRYPGPHGRRPSDVAVEAGMTKQAMNYLLKGLEELGYIERFDDPDDKRSRRIAVTDRGRDVQRVLRASVRGIEADLEADLGATDLAQLRHLLGALNRTAFVTDYRAATGQPSIVEET